MTNITDKLSEAEILMSENTCLLKLMQGYCIYAAENSGSITDLFIGFEIVLDKQKKLGNIMDDITGDVLKVNCPEWFNK